MAGMTEQMGDLTTPESWDDIWRGYQPAQASGLRKRIKMQRQWEQLIAELLDRAEPGESVLELGCAPGAMLALMASLRPDRDYRGIDYAPEGLRVAREVLQGKGVEAELRVGDIRDPSVAKPADLVVSFGLIEHFDDPGAALRHHRAFARPGGHVAVAVPNYSHPVVMRLLRRFSPETLATHNTAIMSPAAMVQAMTAAGLDTVTAGHCGPAAIPSSRVRKNAAGRAFGYAARAWTLGTQVLPTSWPWSSSVWAVGRNPG